MHRDGELSAGVGADGVRPTTVSAEELASAAIRTAREELIRAVPDESNFGVHRDQPRAVRRIRARFGVAAEAALRAARVPEAAEQVQFELAGNAVRHAR